ncbi:transporter family protein [Algoriphagus halophytocola]|uniref:Transporter n=1 Tax=Algoriphagus halophytocola TaxID=2991499 RepID=A0ABY6MFC4_9BACT|nr:transporter [Algoriphagus sp. TR-M5]UZD21883.1 transporter [Algoriphagus sp. TR-M5]
MKITLRTLVLLVGGLVTSYIAMAQTPTDGLMMPKGDLCILVNYEYGQFDHYWEGETLRKNGTIAKVQRRTALAMAAYGITNKLDAYIGLPYVSTNSTTPNGGKFAGASGIQDLSLGLKYEALRKRGEKGELTVFGSVLFSTPVSNYLSDYQPYSIGIGAPQLAWRGVVEYEWNSGWYARGQGGYIWKGYTQAEREYYYNDGSYYTSWMDVPSAWTYEAVVGKWFMDKSLRVEVSFNSSRSTSGDDIRAYNAPQPTNRVDMDRVGAFAQYFFKSVKGLGLVAAYSRVVHGRNAPEMSSISGGVTYQFGLFNPKN